MMIVTTTIMAIDPIKIFSPSYPFVSLEKKFTTVLLGAASYRCSETLALASNIAGLVSYHRFISRSPIGAKLKIDKFYKTTSTPVRCGMR